MSLVSFRLMLAVAALAVLALAAVTLMPGTANASSCFGPRPSADYKCVCFRTTDISGRTVRKCYWQRR